MATDTQSLDLYGRDNTAHRLKEGYETHSDYEEQGSTRVLKSLMMPVHVKVSSPMFPDMEVVQERILRRGDQITVEELGLIALEKGERLGAFFTTAELRAGGHNLTRGGQPVPVSSADLDNEPKLNELGAHELVAWLGGQTGKTPTVDEVLEAVGSDSDFAKRVIEAERTRDPDDPRKTLVGPLQKIAEGE